MIGLTLCSGIGAPEVAAPWVDWRFASEIDPFPREVLHQRHGYSLPEDHNQGDPLLWDDMTEVTPELLRNQGIPLPDLIVAGTPCQAFSIAGLRQGVKDDRGNLTLKFVEIVHAIQSVRPDGRLAVVWENVPGILSDKENAFGCFLGGLVGAMDALQPPGDGSWPGEGMVQGPRARAAWSVLDAQWFGVAQRRRRVFVVVDFGNCVDPAAVLLEPDGLRGDTPPSRETGEGIAASLTASSGGCSGKDKPEGRVIAARMTAIGEYADDDTASSLKARDYKDATDLVAHSLRGEGYDASEDGTGRGTPVVAFDCKGTAVQTEQSGGETPLRSMGHKDSQANAGGHAAIAIQERAVAENPDHGPDGAVSRTDDVSYTLEARTTPQAVAFAQNQQGEVRTADVVSALSAGSGKPGQGYPAVAFKQSEGVAYGDAKQADASSMLSTLRKEVGEEAFIKWGAGILAAFQSPQVLQSWLHGKGLRDTSQNFKSIVDDSALPRPKDKSARSLHQMWFHGPNGCSPQGRGLAKQLAGKPGTALSVLPHSGTPESNLLHMRQAAQGARVLLEALSKIQEMGKPPSGERQSAHVTAKVRRLMPIEAERLQGFPDGFTRITYRNKPALDGPRYKALGNSMAVPVMRWILDRVRISWEQNK